MGLIIENYKKNGNDFVNAYGKVSKITYDNDTKIASFEIAIYPEKGSKNLIDTIKRQWGKISDKDVIVTCYEAIENSINSIKDQILQKEEAIELVVEGDPIRIQMEHILNGLNEDPILQLEGAVNDDVEPIVE